MAFVQIDPGSLKANLCLYLPALLELIVQKNFNWPAIEKLLNQHLNDRIVELDGRESMFVDAHLADIIIEAKKGNLTAIGLLDFLNKVCEDLAGNLHKKEKQLISRNIRQMLTAFDHRYLDFAGELAVLNNLIKSKLYRLEGIEKRTSNSKPIDFELRSVTSQELCYVEIVSIHLNPDRIENDPLLIEKFINRRILKKFNEKTIDQQGPRVYHLIPILWGSAVALKVYSHFFRTNRLNPSNVLEPCAFLMQINSHGHRQHRFGTISQLFLDSVE